MSKDKIMVIGIDPGVKGGIALRTMDSISCITFKNEDQMYEAFYLTRARICEGMDVRFIIETEQYMPGDGGVGTFTFGCNYGFYKTAVRMFDPWRKRTTFVKPPVWQGFLGCMSGGDKNKTKEKAKQLFPDYPKITHAIADAMLIAEYGWRLLPSAHNH